MADKRQNAPASWTRKLQRLYNRLNHTPHLTRAQKRDLRLQIDYLRAAIASAGLLTPKMPTS